MLECECLSHNGFLTTRGYAALAKLRSEEVNGPQLEMFAQRGVDTGENIVHLDRVRTVRALPEGDMMRGFERKKDREVTVRVGPRPESVPQGSGS